ncbi:MAG: (Fe-S)-binding protein [Bryobacterales bacterium]|nr:(Fe-S)-binding protein [Bryobacteraceae bacterium]MDW8353987.1 (Fe-S)-binding protein [Bryobacterales bacterium]
MHRSWPEMALFAALLSASLWAFWVRFRRVWDAVWISKPDPDLRLRPLRPRLRDFVREVMLQSKVIRERPLAGLAHAFVFWGFCAFALVTLDHLVSGFGVDWIVPESRFGRVYFGAAAVFAVAVAVSITALAIRRFLVRPRWLGEVSLESGLIALLIFVLMVTYLAGWQLPEESLIGRANWWLHTLALLVFLPIIPRTKHLHLLLSPFAVFLRRPSFAAIPPLVGDEDFGLHTGRDVTRLVALQAYCCVECGRCTEHCPAYNTGKRLNPKEIILGIRAYLNDFGPSGEAPLVGAHIPQEAVFQCTTCGACEFQCPVGIQHLPVIVGLRRGEVNTGRWQDEHGTRLFLNLERHGNPLGFAFSEREKFIQRAGFPWFDGTQDVCLWLGCMGSYDPQGREIVVALGSVLRFLGIRFGVLRRERCSGDPARRLGNDLLFRQLAEANLEELRKAGARRLLSICPHCVRTIGQDWNEFGADIRIEHHSELLARHAERLPAGKAHQRVVFHDPCYLGRYGGIYDEPRAVARLAGELVEPPRTRRRSFCCGAGGGLAFLGEEKGTRVNAARAAELAATGASIVAAACPFCRTMFRDALGSLEDRAPELRDIAEIAARAIEARIGE